ncbi:MAG TPA: prephenate dehydratase domain-containing protein [Negativicutes bacterium]|nr:prephenate dehydratase domain-containing protein [Negativicutes bacterium]
MKKNSVRVFTVLVTLVLFLTGTVSADVGYLGPAATYTEEASILFFGDKEIFVPMKTVPETLAGVKSGELQYAVVPIENTVGGPVYNYLDGIINDSMFVVVGEINLPIRQTLMAVPGTVLSDIKTVLSHPQGITQGKDWLKANLPDAKLIEVSSTAEGARKVAEGGDKSIVAIASPQAAVTYKLDVLAKQIEVTKTNVTRFWVVTLKPFQKVGQTRTALVAQGVASDFSSLLRDVERIGYKLVSVHDRPAKTVLGEYVFVVELDGDGRREALGETVAKHAGTMKIRILGSYDVK